MLCFGPCVESFTSDARKVAIALKVHAKENRIRPNYLGPCGRNCLQESRTGKTKAQAQLPSRYL